MLFRTRPWLLCTALLCLAPACAVAQRYLVHTYSEADGLPSSSVRGIMQDSSGVMWFATRAGLAIYDGATWNARPFGEESLFDQAHIVEDSRGTIWSVNSRTPVRVVRSQGRTWEHLPRCNLPSPRALYVLHLAVLERAGATFVLLATDTDDLCLWDGKSWTVVDTGIEPDNDSIQAISAMEDVFLVATGTGIHVLDPAIPDAGLSRYAAVPSGPVCGVEYDKARARLWVIGTDWIGMVQNSAFEILASGLDLQQMPTLMPCIARPDAQGGLYLATITHAFYFHPRLGIEKLDQRNGLVSGGATSFCVDREGNVWLGSLRGVSKIVSRRFASYDREHGLYADEVSAVMQMRNGQMILGHPGGLTFLETPPRTMYLGEGFDSRVLDLAEDRLGNLWVAAEYRGLVRIGAAGEVESFGPEQGLEQVSSVQVDSAGTLWVASSNNLFRRENQRFVEVPLPHDVLGYAPHIRRIDAGANGSLYLSTNHGVFLVANGNVEWWTHPDGGLVTEVFAVHEAANGERWIGTRAGLYRAVDGNFEPVTDPGPTLTRPIYFMTRDASRQVWFGTDLGVARWDGEVLRRYDVHDGLIGLETNRAAGVLDASGHLWIGTDRGVSVYRAAFDQPRPGLPLVRLLDMESAGDTLSLATDHRLEHDRNVLTFRFAAISFVDEKAVRFRYRLDGFDDGWLGPDPLPLREVRYTNVPPGSYRFRIQAVDVEGRLSASAVSAAVIILRPLWARLWFQLLAGAFGVGMFYFIVTSISKSRYAKRLEDSQRRLLALFDHSIDAICLLDDNGGIVAANPTMCALTGNARGELERAQAIRVVPDEDRDELLAAWNAFRRDGQAVGESHVVHTSGSIADVEYHAVADITPGLHLLTLRDITARKKTEDALRRNERLASIGTLAAGIAHEINNPVGGIRMAAQFALRSRQQPAAKRIMETALRDVEEDSRRCAQIVDSVLRLAQRIPPEKEPCDMNGIVRAAVESMRGYADERDAVIQFVPAHADPHVLANPTDLERALGNVIRNAIEADASKIDVEVEAQDSDNAVFVHVADNGRGMPAPDLERLFDPFFTTRRKYGGTGLGLSLVHVIVSDHGGDVDVRSVLGEGSTFTVRLPVHARAKSGNDESVDR